MRLRTKLAAAGASTALVAGAAGVAFASWSSTGSGAATAKSTHDSPSVIASAAAAADLYPGATKSVTVTVTNPNPYPIVVTSISAGSSDLVNDTCAAGSVTSDARALDASGLKQSDGTTTKVAPSESGTYMITTHMIVDPTDACKDQAFNLPLTATAQSAA